ncbi:hypothetical protein GN244_ATG08731 [Phytophthora infestans]|uniref:Uncharacterized protein n=1 Tax=Phytophthora infestans TaxID=4787 RepID=A0A833SWH5_PHYIN|nr:hypothetical protein GN244_ATG08731 [Phytophthora infestans]
MQLEPRAPPCSANLANLAGDSITFETVGLQASGEVIDGLTTLPGKILSSKLELGVGASNTKYDEIWQYDEPFNVKENVWYPVEVRVNATAGNIVFSIDGKQVFDIILTEMGFTNDQPSFYGYASRGEGDIGFGGWQDQASYVLVPEFGGQNNAHGV